MFHDLPVSVFHIQKMEHFLFMEKETPAFFQFFSGIKKLGHIVCYNGCRRFEPQCAYTVGVASNMPA